MIKFSTDILKEFFTRNKKAEEFRKHWYTDEDLEQIDQPEEKTGNNSSSDDEIIKLSQLIPEQPGTSPCGKVKI